ncbi:hypothetical protein IT403_02590 [Candidatus Nomurabacteria bacterium]|nr:hypothetical protein [Candidatus Nomurabacteria bacterium]
MEETVRQSGKSHYHIHFDGKVISPKLESWAIQEKGFWWDNFLTSDGVRNYAPDRHLTFKPKTGREFKMLCNEIKDYLKSNPNELIGYLECEHIKNRQIIPWKEFDPSIKFPFLLKTTTLKPGTFRESEIHVSLSKGDSDPRLLENFEKGGFFTAFTERDHGVNIVFTTQGHRKDIAKIWEMLANYLLIAGGGKHCHMKEERITQYWVSSPDYPLPPIVSKILI